VAIGQEDAASDDALRPETMCELLRGLLAAAVDIEGEINGARRSHSCRNWSALRCVPTSR